MSVPLGKRLRRSARALAIVAVLRVASLLPRRWCHHLGAMLGRLAFFFAKSGRRLTLEHLALALPHLTDRQCQILAQHNFEHLGRLALEMCVIKQFDRELERLVHLTPGDEATVRTLLRRGNGLLVVGGHLGNWELLARRLARLCTENAVIARRSWHPRLDRFAYEFRQRAGIVTLWREEPATARALIRLFKEGHSLGLLIDQDTHVQSVFVPFFGRPAFTPRAVGDLALRFGAPILLVTSHRRADGSGHEARVTEVEIDDIDHSSTLVAEEKVVAITARCSQLIEAAIRDHPEQWVWLHRRWKTQPNPRPVL